MNNKPILKRVVIFYLIPLFLILLYLVVHYFGTLPKASGEISLEGLKAPVLIDRDSLGVIHLKAEYDNDAFLAIGYFHAQDRLWQMELARRTGKGTLSEVLGMSVLDSDKFVRTLGIHRVAASAWDALGERAKMSLTSYTQGVNAWLKSGQPLPIEFDALGYEPEVWTEIDSLVIAKLYALELSGHFQKDLNRLILSRHFSMENILGLFPYVEKGPLGELAAIHSELTVDKHAVFPSFLSNNLTVGSNALVISGKLTKSGKPILAHDVHLTPSQPSTLYAAELKGDKLHTFGAMLPGLPVVLYGNNQNIIWASANMKADTQDLFVEKVGLLNPNTYHVNGVQKNMDIVEERIRIKTESPSSLREPIPEMLLRVRVTEHGPMISDVLQNVAAPMSLSWTGLVADDQSYEALLQINYASNWEEFRLSLSKLSAPALNYVYADTAGNIGYSAAGDIPIRHHSSGSFPVEGWREENNWTGMIPFEQLKGELNPQEGIAIFANQNSLMDSYSYVVSEDWELPFRFKRIHNLLNEHVSNGEKISIADIELIQQDSYDLFAAKLTPLLLTHTATSDIEKEALKALAEWDFVADKESRGAVVFQSWVRQLKNHVLNQQLTLDLGNYNQNESLNQMFEQVSSYFLIDLLQQSNSLWCDKNKSKGMSSCTQLLSESFTASVNELELFFGDDVDDWRWGDIHKVRYNHPLFGDMEVLDAIFNRSEEASGSEYSVNYSAVNFSLSDGFVPQVVTDYRAIIEAQKPIKNHYSLATGISGNLLSQYYDNMVEGHVSGKLYDADFTKKWDSAPPLTLTPAKGVN